MRTQEQDSPAVERKHHRSGCIWSHTLFYSPLYEQQPILKPLPQGRKRSSSSPEQVKPASFVSDRKWQRKSFPAACHCPAAHRCPPLPTAARHCPAAAPLPTAAPLPADCHCPAARHCPVSCCQSSFLMVWSIIGFDFIVLLVWFPFVQWRLNFINKKQKKDG